MIFVSIASFRDKELIKTVKSCVNNAKYPSGLKIGICWQYDEEEDLSALDGIPNLYIDKIFWKDVKGSVCWARYLIQQKYFTDEDYYLQIDSHTHFDKNWDETFIKMLDECPSAKPILSAGPPYYYSTDAEGALPAESFKETYLVENVECDKTVFKQKLDQISGSGLFMYGFLPAEDTSLPIPARHISAALIFTKGRWVREVPYDPNLYFHGEEGSLALRSYTRGYDIFNPNKNVLWHLKYNFPLRKRHWNSFDKSIVTEFQKVNMKRYREILTGELKGVYGLGLQRSYDDWVKYSGVDYVNGTASEDAKKGITPTLL